MKSTAAISMRHENVGTMRRRGDNSANLFDGCNFRASLFRFVIVPLDDCLNLLLHTVAQVWELLHIRQQQQSHKQHSTTHHIKLRHTAVAPQTLRKQTTPRISQRALTLHYTPLHVPITHVIHNRTSRIQPKRQSPPPPIRSSSHTCPCLPS